MVADLRTEGKVQGIGPARSQELRCEAKRGTRCSLWVLLVVLGGEVDGGTRVGEKDFPCH